MRLSFSLPQAHPKPAVDVVVDADESVTVEELALAVRVDPARLFPGVDAEAAFGDTGVLVGETLPRENAPLLPPGTLRLEVVGGPYAGESIALPGGNTIAIGSARSAQLRLIDPTVADAHAMLEVPPQQSQPSGRGARADFAPVIFHPSDVDAPVLVNGARIDEATECGPDDYIQIGASLFRVGRVPERNTSIPAESPGRVAFNRASRIVPPTTVPVVKLPGEKPVDAERSPIPWLSALIPVLIGVVAAIVFQRMFMLLFAAAAPLMVIGTYFTSKRAAKRSGKRTVEKWQEEIVDARDTLALLTRNQRTRAWATRMDPVLAADIALTPLARLWERRVTDADALGIRVGVGEQDLSVTFEGERVREAGEAVALGLSPVPIEIDLARGVAGIAGPRPVTLSVARSLLIQLAVSRSPRDLSMMLLCADDSAEEWSWLRWLPHADGGTRAIALVGNSAESRHARLNELGSLLEARRAADPRGTSSYDAQTVVVIDNPREFRTLPGMVTLLDQGPRYGIFVLALAADRSELPEESVTEVLVDPEDVTLAQVVSATNPCPVVLLDGCSRRQAERIARALSPIVHVGGAGDDNLLPQSVRFVDLQGIDLDSPDALLARWAYSPRDTRAVVGAGVEGPFALDLASDGPHGLVAGTTGAGKSEFLQTLVVSLALVNRPDALNFVLVDYKGGSAFADCERLPHTVGLVTNLDGRETERALESLDAELKRREGVLRDMGAKDADTAWAKDPDMASRRGLARLVLVIDEFAELRAELPEFVTGLVRIARVGRSLGVHLILATQRPAGSITPEMQSNTNLRVSLRVTDKADSIDVLGSPEASLIASSTPGRGYARRGVGAAPAAFQTARVAGRRPGISHAAASVPRVLTRSWREIGLPAVFPKQSGTADHGPIDHDDTDLRALVNVITSAAVASGVPKNPSPWLEPLPLVVGVDDIPAPEGSSAVVLGREDVPSEQTQRPLLWDVRTQSHVALIGGSRSGRTSTLRTIVAQLAQNFAPHDLHLYGVDYGTGALAPMDALPHTGAVITAMDGPRLDAFMDRLAAEIRGRQQNLSRGAFGGIEEQRAASGPGALPFIVVLIDGWDRLLSELGQDRAIAFRERLLRVLREGPAVGVRIVLTGDRGLFNDKVAGFIDTRYVFPLTDRGDYLSAGLKASALPEHIAPGRVYFGAPMREVQMALLPGGAAGDAQNEAFRTIIREVSERWRAAPDVGLFAVPFRVDPLPHTIALSEALQLPLSAGGSESGVTVAVGGDTLSRFVWDPAEAPGFLVVGERRSGRSGVLTVLAGQLLGRRRLVVVAPKASPLRGLAEKHGVPLITEAGISAADAMSLLTSSEPTSERTIVFIDDFELLKASALAQTLMDLKDSLVFVMAIAQDDVSAQFGGVFGEVKRAGQGMLLSPAFANSGVQSFGAAVPSGLLGRADAGRAALFNGDGFIAAQVPLSDGVE
ncbi:S-DNA-T family DNA segregation ATPase FtsK/SpoIIIE [Mycetocola sp. BIGb0189]|uniref:FtsK/SpoIIIE domain-containing protein n=1 Tax=Mycetocola sp. BIGb0189 TaxID=2940604 RepID=UPI00216847D0|nr:FtsK/SpoIIIE domain-containing protein [Mycetocola sp. BIGb0189]MCS4276682.1 S-DNA-T family DNA segregation ATPase FtsK/SpoIIIE [Mycetocola sp. BIGb0189]